MKKKQATYDGDIIRLNEELANAGRKNRGLYQTCEARKKRIEELEAVVEGLTVKYETLLEQYRLAVGKIYGRASEKKKAEEEAGQQNLFNEAEMELFKTALFKAEAKGEEYQTIPEHKRRRRRDDSYRKELPKDLPVIAIENDLSEEDKKCPCCGEAMAKIGEQKTGRLGMTRPEFFFQEITTPQYACSQCKKIKQAPAPPSIIPGSITTPGLLAGILGGKFISMLPFYRQEQDFGRRGIDISRQDMANWQVKAAEVLEPLILLMKEEMKEWNILRMDETTVQVMGEKDRKDTGKSYIWIARGGTEDKPAVIYKYDKDHPTRERRNIDEFLQGFKGYLQTDGYDAYDAAVKSYPDVTHVGCWAHARRKFIDAEKAGKDKDKVSDALKFIQDLYIVEHDLRVKLKNGEITNEEFVKKRKEETKAALALFRQWLDEALLVQKDGDKGLFARAVGYTSSQWPKLVRYLLDAGLTPDNNLTENTVRPFAVGRKNLMFFKCPDGASSGCVLYSLIETAQTPRRGVSANGLDPFAYLEFLFEKAPLVAKPEDWVPLLPWNAKASLSPAGHS
jgi:transposase